MDELHLAAVVVGFVIGAIITALTCVQPDSCADLAQVEFDCDLAEARLKELRRVLEDTKKLLEIKPAGWIYANSELILPKNFDVAHMTKWPDRYEPVFRGLAAPLTESEKTAPSHQEKKA